MPGPWSTSALRKLGVCIRDGVPVPAELPAYSEVMLWYTDLAASVQRALSREDWSSILGSTTFEVTSRPKTIDTLREKLLRDRSTPLQNVQDVAGVRLEAEMTLDQQDAVAQHIALVFEQDPEIAIHDLRSNPHSGYRAVHVWLRLDGTLAAELDGRVEVQVRTHLQSQWANMYESAADTLGREIRYDGMPSQPEQVQLVEALRALSLDNIASLEHSRNQIEKLEQEIVTAQAAIASISALPQLSHDPDLKIARATSEANMTRVKELKALNLTKERDFQEKLFAIHETFRTQPGSAR